MLTGASAEDADADLVRRVCELEVGGAGGLLAVFEPLIVAVVTNPSKYGCRVLQTSAVLTLAKYMLIRCVCVCVCVCAGVSQGTWVCSHMTCSRCGPAVT